MPHITIAPDKCTGDGLCVLACPRGLFELRDGKAVVLPEAVEICIGCGHCVAVCPAAAVSLRDMNPDDCEYIEPGMRLFPDTVEQFLMTRRSCRAFKDDPVAKETLEEIMDLTRWAPSAVNRQPVEWIFFQKREDVRKVAEAVVEWARDAAANLAPGPNRDRLVKLVHGWQLGKDHVCRGAPHLVLAHAPAGVPLMAQDVTCAVMYLELGVHAHRLGACWAGFVMLAAKQSSALQDLLNLPDGHELYGGLMLGHPRYRFRRIPLRFEAQVEWR